MRTMTFAAGLAAGYVLGAKAGRERYDQISAAARRLSEQPLISQTQSALKDAAQNTGQAAAAKIAALAPNPPAGTTDGGSSSSAMKTGSTAPQSQSTSTPRTASPPTPTPTEAKANAGSRS